MEVLVVVVLVCVLLYWISKRAQTSTPNVPITPAKKARHWLDADLLAVRNDFESALRSATTTADVDVAEAQMMASKALEERIPVTDKIRDEFVSVATRWRSALALLHSWSPETDLVALGTINGVEYVWKSTVVEINARGDKDDCVFYVTQDELIYDSPSKQRRRKLRDIVDMAVVNAAGSFSDIVFTVRNRVNKERISFQAGIEATLVVDIIAYLKSIAAESGTSASSSQKTKTAEKTLPSRKRS